MPLNVLHLIGGGEIGGAENNVLNLVVNFDQEKVKPFLGCLIRNSPFASLARSMEIPAEIFPMKYPLDLCPVIQITGFCKKNKIGLIHCHGVRANLLGRIAAKLLSLPVISTVHSLPKYDYPSSWKGKLALFFDDKTLSLSSGIIAVSKSLLDAVSWQLKKKALTTPVRTIYNGIPLLNFDDYETSRKDFRHKWNIPPEKKVIGTIGRLHPVKGQIFLARAMNLLAKEFPDLHLLIIGEGPQHSELENFLNSSGLSFTLTGYLSSAWKALPAMDIFVLPSLNEGMGIVLLEAAQARIPVVASKVGGIPELFPDDNEALLIRPADTLDLTQAISKILKNEEYAKVLLENAAKRAGLFSVKQMVEETTDFYFGIINR